MSAPTLAAPPCPQGVNPKEWALMTPRQRATWESRTRRMVVVVDVEEVARSVVGPDGVRRDRRGRPVRVPDVRPQYTQGEMRSALSMYERHRKAGTLGELPECVRVQVRAAWAMARARRVESLTSAPAAINH